MLDDDDFTYSEPTRVRNETGASTCEKPELQDMLIRREKL